MRKLITLLAIVLIAPGFLPAQELARMKIPAPKVAAPGDYDCPPNSIFSQTPSGQDNSWINSFSYIQVIYENFNGVTPPISGIRFWQMKNETITYPIQFRIEFYADNGGTLGALINSWTLNLSPSFTTVDGLDVIDVTLPSPVNLSSGWLGINADDPRLGPGDVVGWVNNSIGDGFLIYSMDLVNYALATNGYNASFCLVGVSEEPTEVPVSDWAVLIAIGLIIGFTLFRFRKLF